MSMEKYRMESCPVCKKEAVVQGDKFRISILTPALIRLEYEENGKQVIVNTIRTIVEDEYNNLWIGTNSGLLKFNKEDKKFKSYTEKRFSGSGISGCGK